MVKTRNVTVVGNLDKKNPFKNSGAIKVTKKDLSLVTNPKSIAASHRQAKLKKKIELSGLLYGPQKPNAGQKKAIIFAENLERAKNGPVLKGRRVSHTAKKNGRYKIPLGWELPIPELTTADLRKVVCVCFVIIELQDIKEGAQAFFSKVFPWVTDYRSMNRIAFTYDNFSHGKLLFKITLPFGNRVALDTPYLFCGTKVIFTANPYLAVTPSDSLKIVEYGPAVTHYYGGAITKEHVLVKNEAGFVV